MLMLIARIDVDPSEGGVSKKRTSFKELTPHSWTYELRKPRGKKELQIQDKQTTHTVLQKLSPKTTPRPLKENIVYY